MSIQTTNITDDVVATRSSGERIAQAVAADHPYSRQLSAVIWIVLAWIAGTIIFEITAIGSEPKHVVIETDDQPVTLFFHDQSGDSVSPISGFSDR